MNHCKPLQVLTLAMALTGAGPLVYVLVTHARQRMAGTHQA
jgi:hypothetical protein